MGLGLDKIKNRDSSIELLRIVSIFLITLSHWAIHSDFIFETDHLVVNKLLAEFVSLGELGVCAFVIISGYFSIFNHQSIKGFLNLLIKIWIYNLIILAFTQIGGVEEIEFRDIIKFVIPIYNTHWFAYTFLILYILMPFLNRFIQNIEKEELKKIIVILLIGWSAIYSFTGADLQFSYLGWFILLYFLGAYIRLYSTNTNIKIHIGVLTISTALLFLSTIIINVIGLKMGFYPNHGTDLYSVHSPLILAMAVSLFCIFRNINIKNSIIINLIASSAFGTYLLSDNPLLRNWIWNDIFGNDSLSGNKAFLLVGIGEVILIMLICFLIEMIWKIFFNSKLYGAIIIRMEVLIKILFKKTMNIIK